LTLEKVSDEEQPPAVTVAAVTPQAPAPVEQPAAGTMVEEPTPAVEVPLAVESKLAPAATEKGAARPEPVRKETPPVASPRTSDIPGHVSNGANAGRTGSAGITLLAAVTENKVEPPSAPVKKEVSAAPPELKAAVSMPPPAAEPVRESTPFVAVQQEPKIVHLERPVLPDIAVRNHISGSVTAKVMIDKDGKPGEVQILASSSGILEQPVIDAIGKSSFAPGMMGNGPVAAWVVIPFKFK
jgi:TonB family protein